MRTIDSKLGGRESDGIIMKLLLVRKDKHPGNGAMSVLVCGTRMPSFWMCNRRSTTSPANFGDVTTIGCQELQQAADPTWEPVVATSVVEGDKEEEVRGKTSHGVEQKTNHGQLCYARARALYMSERWCRIPLGSRLPVDPRGSKMRARRRSARERQRWS